MKVFNLSTTKLTVLIVFFLLSINILAQVNPEAEKQKFESLDKKQNLNQEELREMLKISDRAQNYDLELAINYLEKAKKHFEKQKDYFFLTEYAEKISLVYMIKGEPQTGIDIANKIAEKYKDKFSEEEWIKLQILNVRFLEQVDKNDEALTLIKKLLPQAKNELHKATLYSFSGGINMDKGNYDLAGKDYYTSLRLYEKLKNEPNIITTYNRLGMLNHAIEDFPKAIKYFNRGLSLALKTNSQRDLTVLYLNMGNLYQKVDSLDKAIYYYDKNLEILQKSNNVPDMARNLLNRGNVYAKQKNFTKAFESYEQALDICNEYNIDFGKMHIYYNMGKGYIQTKEYNKAIPVLDSALYYAKAMEAKDVELGIYYSFSDVYEATGNFEKAYAAYTQYHELEKEVMNEEKHKTLSELEIKYETELKDQKIAQINQSLETKKAQNGLLILGVVLLILIAGFVIFFLIYRNKTLKQLYERNVELMNNFQFKASEEEKLVEITETAVENEDNLKKIFDRILYVLEKEKIYTNPTLSLSETAEHVKSNDKYVSAAIAENANMNYSNFINFYRINEAKRLIYEDGHFNLNEVMYACGFNSRTTFYNAFKKHTGLSPKQFKEMGENNLVLTS